jgi:hypothetical protein
MHPRRPARYGLRSLEIESEKRYDIKPTSKRFDLILFALRICAFRSENSRTRDRALKYHCQARWLDRWGTLALANIVSTMWCAPSQALGTFSRPPHSVGTRGIQ